MILTCDVTNVALDGSGSDSGADIEYEWSGPGIDGTNVNDQFPTVSTAGTYTPVVTNTANGCTSTAEVVVTGDFTPPDISVVSPVILDCNSAGGQVTLSAGSTTPGATYIWTGTGNLANADTSSPTVYNGGTYTVVVINPVNGCTGTAEVEVLLNFGLILSSTFTSCGAEDGQRPPLPAIRRNLPCPGATGAAALYKTDWLPGATPLP